MPEPSVLDYVKAVLAFRRPPRVPKRAKGAAPAVVRNPRPAARQASAIRLRVDTIPWRSLLSILSFLVAQQLWTPPAAGWITAIAAALLGIGAAVWANVAGEWQLPQVEKAVVEKRSLKYERFFLWAGLLFFALTLLLSSNNRFNIVNVTCWMLSIVFVMLAFWQSRRKVRQAIDDLAQKLSKREWLLPISRWTLVLLAVFAVIAFFRFSQLETAPAEMISDHAEKLLDVNDILNGQTSIFFERNTGREPLQFYLTATVAELFNTGLSFLSLKLGTVLLAFFSLVYIYLLGKELGGRWVGLFALILVGVAFWPNLLARTGLRFSLYPTFAAPTLYYLLRGLRRGSINDFLISGLFMGIGLNGYTAFRIMPLVAGAALVLFGVHTPSAELRRRGLIGFALLALVALVVCAPLLRYAVEHPAQFGERTFTRMFEAERVYSEPVLQTFATNVVRGLGLFNYSGGDIWLVGLSGRPAFDIFTASLFLLGLALAVLRYARNRSWLDLFLLISIPLMMLPSTLSLAFPEENPAMNRASGAWIPAFLLSALAIDTLVHTVRERIGGNAGLRIAQASAAIGLLFIALFNSALFFGDYNRYYDASSWNTSELGAVIADYAGSFGSLDSAWVVANAHWVDTRLVGINAGNPTRDYAIWPDQLATTLEVPAPKFFVLRPGDELGLNTLTDLYPDGILSQHPSRIPGKEFLTYFVPAQ
jgi:4-amino-4-deoxy-L-arabinose transferase-like glycosyltransferase